jgi:hypothetical protein
MSPPAAERRSVGWHEIEHIDTFILFAELALGLCGFTGIAATFGGRERSYSVLDKIRIEGIFTLAGSVMLGSISVLTVSVLGTSSATVFGWASLIAASVLCRPVYTTFTRAIPLARDPESSSSLPIALVAVTTSWSCFLIHLANLALWREAFPLLLAFSLQLAWALFLFARMLTQRN